MARKQENLFLLALDRTGPKPLVQLCSISLARLVNAMSHFGIPYDLCSVVRGLLWNPTGARTRGYPRHDWTSRSATRMCVEPTFFCSVLHWGLLAWRPNAETKTYGTDVGGNRPCLLDPRSAPTSSRATSPGGILVEILERGCANKCVGCMIGSHADGNHGPDLEHIDSVWQKCVHCNTVGSFWRYGYTVHIRPPYISRISNATVLQRNYCKRLSAILKFK